MPFIDASEIDPGFRTATGGPPPAPPREPDAGDIWASGFRQNNIIASVIEAARTGGNFAPVDGHNPLDTIRGTKYEQRHLDAFIGSHSPDEDRSIMARIDQEDKDREILDAAGFGGTLVSMLAGVTDPTIFLPGGVIYRGVRIGQTAARSALAVGAAAAGQAALQEGILQQSQITRPISESVMNVASATILGGLIGGGASALLSRSERDILAKSLDELRGDIDRHAAGETAPIAAAAGAAATDVRQLDMFGGADVGAAVADTRKLKPVSFGLDKVPGWSRVARFLGTDLGIYAASSVEARRLASETFETSLRFEQNLAGDVTAPVVPLSREIDIHVGQSKIAVGDELKRLYSEYRFGQPDVTAPYARAEFEALAGRAPEGKMTPADFDREVAAAMNNGDRHAISQVEQAAQFLRRKVFDPWSERMEKANPDFKRQQFGDGQTYFPYRWESERIAAQRPQFVDEVVLPHLQADQATKAAAKQRLTTLNDELKAATERMAKAKTDDEFVAASARETEIREKIESEIAAWEGKSVAEAKAAIKAREKYAAGKADADAVRLAGQEADGTARFERVEGTPAAARSADAPRLTQADSAIDGAVKRIIASDRDLPEVDLRAKAEEIVDHILGTPIGRLPYDSHTAINSGPRSATAQARGPMHARDFAVPYGLAKGWISHDLNQVLGSWMRTMVPDTLMFERFPGEGPAMTSRYRAIQDEYSALAREAKSDKARTRLNKEKDEVIATLDGVVQRMRGLSNNTAGTSGRVGEIVRRTNQMTDLGFAAVTSIPDFAGSIFYHGLTSAFADGFRPLMSKLGGSEVANMSKAELRAMDIAAEIENSTRGHALAEVTDNWSPHTKAERTLKYASDRFFLLNLQAQETNAAKRVAGRVAMSNMLRAIKAEVDGKISGRQRTMLRESNISGSLSNRIWKEFSNGEGGRIVDGVYLPNTMSWGDETARLHFTAAIARDVERSVVTPGPEKPLWLSSNVGSLLGQYKSFGIASTTKILISNLQRSDAQALQGLVAAIGFGLLSYRISTAVRGQPWPERPQDAIKEAISRSGMLGVFEEVNMFTAKATRGQVDVYRLIGADKPLSRNINRTALSSLLGPTAGKVENMLKMGGALSKPSEWNESDTKAFRRMILLQNLVGLNWAFDAAEKGFNGAFGIPMKAR